jgi:Leucine-rich repeat (LRR) protein
MTYSNVILGAVISSPDHPGWKWLVKRRGRIAGVSLAIRATLDLNQLPDWMQLLGILSGIPRVQLRVEWVGTIADVNHPFIAQWLKQHGQLISHLTLDVNVREDRIKLKEFSEAAAPCRSIDLTVLHSLDQVVDLSDLDAVAGSLDCLSCEPSEDWANGVLRGISALTSMSQLSALRFASEDLGREEPWGLLAKLRGLQRLSLSVHASGDPSPLSALVGLTSLYLQSLLRGVNSPAPFRFSSLQPLSTLQQLEVLHMTGCTCAATSLQGLAGLSSLTRLVLESSTYYGLASLEGIPPGVEEFALTDALSLVSLAGIEGCTGLKKLSLDGCGVSSLQPLRGLSNIKDVEVFGCCFTSLEGLNSVSLQSLRLSDCTRLTHLSGVEHLPALMSLGVYRCGVTSLQPLSQLGEGLQELSVIECKAVQEEVLELRHVQPTARVTVRGSNVSEVVLAGG